MEGETWGLLQDGIQGLQSLTMKNKQASNSLAKHAKNCYVQVLTETEINFDSDSEEYHTSSDSEQDQTVFSWPESFFMLLCAGETSALRRGLLGQAGKESWLCVWHGAGVNHLPNRG